MSGTIEAISTQTAIASIWNGCGVMLSHELYSQLKAPVGTLTITNSKTKNVIQIPTKNCFSNSEMVGDGKYASLGKEGKGSVIITKEIASKLSLQANSEVELTNTLSPEDLALWRCGEDKTNQFGSSWEIHSYTTTAFFANCKQDATEEENRYPGIYLSPMQMEQLNLNKSLVPFCGLERFKAISSHSTPLLSGIVRIFFQGLSIETVVYPTNQDFYPRSAIMINQNLYEQLQGLQIGDSIQICSRFDTKDYQTALALQSDPEPEQMLNPNSSWLEIFENSKNLKIIFPIDNCPIQKKLFFASILEELIRNAKTVASKPHLLVNAINIIDHLNYWVMETLEFKRFLQALLKEEATLKENQEQLFEFLIRELFSRRDENPPFLNLLFALGINLKNSEGENCLHLMYRLNNGSVTKYKNSTVFQAWLTDKNNKGKTPLHYLCQQGNSTQIFLIREELGKINPEDFESPEGNPFHELAENLEMTYVQKSSTMIEMIKANGNFTQWFYQLDAQKLNPIMKMATYNQPGLELLIETLMMKFTMRGEDATWNIQILGHLFNIKPPS